MASFASDDFDFAAMPSPKRLPFPVWVLILDSFGVGLLVLGLIGLLAAPEGIWAVFAEPALAWGLTTVGAVLLLVAVALMLISMRRSSARKH